MCVAVCCSVLQCVAVCCSVLQCVAVCCSMLQYVAVCCSMLQWFELQFVDFAGRDGCLAHLHERTLHTDARVRESAAIALGMLASGPDTQSLER